MKSSDIVKLKRDLNAALEAAGRKEFGWFVFLEKLDELGYDLVERPVQPKAIVEAVEAMALIADTFGNRKTRHAKYI